MRQTTQPCLGERLDRQSQKPELLSIKKKAIAISNPGKILYPGGKFRKIDVVDYYEHVARFLLRHLRDRPVTLKRYPNGVYGEAFYEKMHLPSLRSG